MSQIDIALKIFNVDNRGYSKTIPVKNFTDVGLAPFGNGSPGWIREDKGGIGSFINVEKFYPYGKRKTGKYEYKASHIKDIPEEEIRNCIMQMEHKNNRAVALKLWGYK